MTKVVAALGGFKAWQRGADCLPQRFERAAARGPQNRFQFRKTQFDRIEVGAVLRQEPELGTGHLNRLPHGGTLVATEVVHHDDVADAQRGHEHLLDVRQEARAVDRPVEDGRRRQAGDAQRRNERRGVPASIRRVIGDAHAALAAAVPPDQVGADTAFIEKQEAARVQARRRVLPGDSRQRHVGAGVLGRVYRFF